MAPSLSGVLALGVCLQLTAGAMVLTSPEFKNNELIPGDYGCDILNGWEKDYLMPNPPLEWNRVPAKTRSFVLLVDDMDQNNEVLWLVTNIPLINTSLPVAITNTSKMPGTEMTNTYGYNLYAGPCPNGKEHLIRFRLFAMRTDKVNITVVPEKNGMSVTSDHITEQLTHGFTGSDDADDGNGDSIYCAPLYGRYYAPPPPSDYTYCVGEGCPPPPQTQPPPMVKVDRYIKPSEGYKPMAAWPEAIDVARRYPNGGLPFPSNIGPDADCGGNATETADGSKLRYPNSQVQASFTPKVVLTSPPAAPPPPPVPMPKPSSAYAVGNHLRHTPNEAFSADNALSPAMAKIRKINENDINVPPSFVKDFNGAGEEQRGVDDVAARFKFADDATLKEDFNITKELFETTVVPVNNCGDASKELACHELTGCEWIRGVCVDTRRDTDPDDPSRVPPSTAKPVSTVVSPVVPGEVASGVVEAAEAAQGDVSDGRIASTSGNPAAPTCESMTAEDACLAHPTCVWVGTQCEAMSLPLSARLLLPEMHPPSILDKTTNYDGDIVALLERATAVGSEDDNGLDEAEADDLADDEADLVAQGLTETRQHGGDELTWDDDKGLDLAFSGMEGETALLEISAVGDYLSYQHPALTIGRHMEPIKGPNPCLACEKGDEPPPPKSCKCKKPPQFRKYGLTGWVVGEPALALPERFICVNEGKITTLPLAWRHVPAGTKSVLVMLDDVSYDLDDDRYGSVLWLASDIPAATDILQETTFKQADEPTSAMLPAGASQPIPYQPPCPLIRNLRDGRYRLRVMALPTQAPVLQFPFGVAEARAEAVEEQVMQCCRPLMTASIELAANMTWDHVGQVRASQRAHAAAQRAAAKANGPKPDVSAMKGEEARSFGLPGAGEEMAGEMPSAAGTMPSAAGAMSSAASALQPSADDGSANDVWGH